MKPEEKQFFVDLLAPLRELPESLSTSLAPLRDLPSVLRVLAGGSSQDLATDQARADDQHAAARVAELAGLEPVWGESLEDVVKRAIKHAVSQAIEQASIASPHELQSAREQGRIEAFAALVHTHSLEVPDGGRAQDVLNDAIVAGLASENAIAQAFDAGREAGRVDGTKDVLASLASRAGAPELIATEDRLADLLRDGIESGASLREVRERAATGALLALFDDVFPGARHERTGTGKVEDLVNGELRVEIARRVRDRVAIERDNDQVSHLTHDLDQVREKLALSELERANVYAILRRAVACTGRAVDGMTNVQLASHLDDIARVALPTSTIERDRALQNLGEIDVTLRRVACTIGVESAISNMSETPTLDLAKFLERSITESKTEQDVLAATLGRRAQDELRALDGQIRQTLLDLGHVDDAEDTETLVTRLIAIANTRTRQRDAADQDADGAISELQKSNEFLTEARDTVARIDSILRPAVAAAGVPVEDATVLEIAERLVLIASRAVLANETEIPRSARDGSRKTIREIVAALGLDLQTDHLTVPRATSALVQALQGGQGAERGQERPAGIDPDTASLRVLDELRAVLALQVNLAKLSPSEARDALAQAVRALVVNARHEELDRGRQLVIDAVCEALACRPPNRDESISHWAIEVAGKGGADTARERAIVIQAVQDLGGDDAAHGASLTDACALLDDRVHALKTWARDSLPLLALWDALAVQDCPLAFERVKRPLDGMGKESPPRDVSDAHEDQDDWRPLAHDLRAVVDGDDPTALAAWLKTGQDVRALIEVALDRVAHLEDECSESEDRIEVARSAISGNVEELARALWEHWPLGVPADVAQQVLDHDDLDDIRETEIVEKLRSAINGARVPRDLESWCALTPAERNRLVDRTRDAFAAVNG